MDWQLPNPDMVSRGLPTLDKHDLTVWIRQLTSDLNGTLDAAIQADSPVLHTYDPYVMLLAHGYEAPAMRRYDLSGADLLNVLHVCGI